VTEWWQVLIVAFCGGFIGGTVAWQLELRARKRASIEEIEKMQK